LTDFCRSYLGLASRVLTLLGVSSDKLGDTTVGFPKGGETFASYGRAFAFLDTAETGLKAHNKEFLVDAITAKHGHVVNTGAQSFNCQWCGTKSFGGGEYLYVAFEYLCT
jgi:hypothetical protein